MSDVLQQGQQQIKKGLSKSLLFEIGLVWMPAEKVLSCMWLGEQGINVFVDRGWMPSHL